MEMQDLAPSAPGKTMLKVCGILYIVFGGLSFMVGLYAMLGTAMLSGLVESAMWEEVGMMVALAFALSLGALVQSGFSIFVGVMAVTYAAVLEKATFLRTIIIVHAAMLLIAITVDSMHVAEFSPLSLVGFVVPIIAFIGARQNVRAHKQEITPKG